MHKNQFANVFSSSFESVEFAVLTSVAVDPGATRVTFASVSFLPVSNSRRTSFACTLTAVTNPLTVSNHAAAGGDLALEDKSAQRILQLGTRLKLPDLTHLRQQILILGWFQGILILQLRDHHIDEILRF
jgi:hypothetical protein